MSDASLLNRPDGRLVPDEILTPGVRDERQRAYVEIIDAGFQTIDIQTFVMSDADTVDAKMLPFMAREFSVEEFIDSDLPDKFVRRFIKNAYELHAQKGYVSGTRLGLRMLGIEVEWEQWWQQEPKGRPNTHIATTYLTEDIFADEDVFLSPKAQEAVLRVINATKRWSQEISFRLGIKHPVAGLGVAASTHSAAVSRNKTKPGQGEIQRSAAFRIAGSTHNTAVARNRTKPGQGGIFRDASMGVGAALLSVAVCRFRCDFQKGPVLTEGRLGAASTFKAFAVVRPRAKEI